MESEECVYAGSFLHFHIKTLQNSKGKPVVWEVASRSHDNHSQGVDIIPKLGDHYILNLEYRYPVSGTVLSFPGGICDDPNVAGQAIKELKEETGYTAFISPAIEVSPMLYNDPWKSTEKTQYVSLQVYEPENQVPEQELEELEVIRPVLVHREHLLQEIQSIAEQQHTMIDSRLYAYALGLFYGNTNKNE